MLCPLEFSEYNDSSAWQSFKELAWQLSLPFSLWKPHVWFLQMCLYDHMSRDDLLVSLWLGWSLVSESAAVSRTECLIWEIWPSPSREGSLPFRAKWWSGIQNKPGDPWAPPEVPDGASLPGPHTQCACILCFLSHVSLVVHLGLLLMKSLKPVLQVASYSFYLYFVLLQLIYWTVGGICECCLRAVIPAYSSSPR